jgi:hypothetical protein
LKRIAENIADKLSNLKENLQKHNEKTFASVVFRFNFSLAWHAMPSRKTEKRLARWKSTELSVRVLKGNLKVLTAKSDFR